MFILNLTIEEDLCNIRCEYCWLTNQDEFVRRNKNMLTVFSKKQGNIEHKKLPNLLNRVETILSNTKSTILKISGGEIFLLPEVIHLLVKYSYNYKIIQILTNGTILETFPLDILDNKKFAFQVSIDGHTNSSNYHRFGKASKHFTPIVLKSIYNLYTLGFNVEINSVITPQNIYNLKDFLLYINKSFPKITVYPFPVRFTLIDFYFKQEQLSIIDDILEISDKLKVTLPPLPYIRYLSKFIENNRNFPCYLPSFISSIDSDGDVSICPCGNIATLGNYFNDSFKFESPAIDHPIVTKIVNMEYDKCKECFTHFDVINLYCMGVVSYNDLGKCGIFQDKNILESMNIYKTTLAKKTYNGI